MDLFVEDRGHEEFIKALVQRLADEDGRLVTLRVRAARGGHGKALGELDLYRRLHGKALIPAPDVLVVAIDANCKTPLRARKEVRDRLGEPLGPSAVLACPDPHVELWYMADPDSFSKVVGVKPRVGRKKCARDRYKRILLDTVRRAGQIPTLGGLEFAGELVREMDLYRAGKNQSSLAQFMRDMRNALRSLPGK